MTPPLYARLAGLRAEGRQCAVATVVRTQGSTPQIAGAKLLLDDLDRTAGTLGGGCVEADAIIAAREVLAGGPATIRAYELTEDLAWNTGLVCGGTMWILAEPADAAYRAAGRDLLPELAAAAAGERPPLAVATLFQRTHRVLTCVGRLFLDADGVRLGSVGDAGLDDRLARLAADAVLHATTRVLPIDDALELLVETVAGRPHLVIAGGGHVALALAHQARLLDFDVTVFEDRPEFADPARFHGASVVAGDIAAGLASLPYGWNTFVVVATRGHKLDAECMLAAARTPARYIGLLGSRRKAVLIARMLEDAGIQPDRMQAIRTPVGLDLGGRTPAEIALAVLAEITQERYRASGRPLGQPIAPRAAGSVR